MEPLSPHTRTTTDPQGDVRKLYRSPSDRQLGGVCSGIARYTNTDPTVIRVVFVVVAIMGPGLLLYPLLWLLVPEEPPPSVTATPQPTGPESAQPA